MMIATHVSRTPRDYHVVPTCKVLMFHVHTPHSSGSKCKLTANLSVLQGASQAFNLPSRKELIHNTTEKVAVEPPLHHVIQAVKFDWMFTLT